MDCRHPLAPTQLLPMYGGSGCNRYKRTRSSCIIHRIRFDVRQRSDCIVVAFSNNASGMCIAYLQSCRLNKMDAAKEALLNFMSNAVLTEDYLVRYSQAGSLEDSVRRMTAGCLVCGWTRLGDC